MLFFSVRGDVAAFAVQLQLVLLSQLGDEAFVFLGRVPPQFVIEMNHGENNANPLVQFEQQTKQRN